MEVSGERRETLGSVLEIWRYPVSSLAGEELSSTELTSTGVASDRLFGLFDETTHGIAEPGPKKRWDRVPSFHSRSVHDGRIELSPDGERWGQPEESWVKGELEKAFGSPMRVLRYGETYCGTLVSPRYKRAPVHLLSRQALEQLQALLPDSVIDARRFRPNLVVDLPGSGSLPPENQLIGREFRIGPVLLRGTFRSGRCAFVTLEQRNIPGDPMVLKALISEFERDFGIYCDVLENGVVSAGDQLVLNTKPQPIIIVGAGQAGAMTAKALRRLGATEKIELFGDERHMPYERPPLSKSANAVAPSSTLLSVEDAESLNVGLHLNTRIVAVDRINKTIQTEQGEEFGYHRLVLATGGSARRLVEGVRGYGRVHTVRTYDDARNFWSELKPGSKLFVLGGGWLGLEIAAAASAKSCIVTLFDRNSRVCSRVLPEIASEYLHDLHRGNHVKLVLNFSGRFRELDDGVEVLSEEGAGVADCLATCIGMIANDSLARMSGLACQDGVITDESGRTNDPDIFAVGDVARQRMAGTSAGQRIESWQNANEQPDRAARAILGLAPASSPPLQFWSDQYGKHLQIVGLPDNSAQPLSPLNVDDQGEPFWAFDGFAVAVNRPADIFRFGSALTEKAITGDEPEQELEADGGLTRLLIGSSSKVSERRLTRFETDKIGPLSVTEIAGRYYAVQDECPHGAASLSEGFLEENRVVCPLHFAEFRLTDGVPRNAPAGCKRARCYRVERDGDSLFALVSTTSLANGSRS